MLRAMCGVQLKDRKGYADLMFMLGLKKAIDQLATAYSVRWHGHVLREHGHVLREDGHVLRRENCHILRRTLDYEVEGQKKKGRPTHINSPLQL